MSFIKICGLSSKDAVEVCVSYDADALGFVFSESPRQVSIDMANKLVESVPINMLKIAVFLNLNETNVQDVLREFRPDWVQANFENSANVRLPSDIIFLPVYRNTGPRPSQEKKHAALLYEGASSGVGELSNWKRAKQLSKKNNLILAGGLNHLNVQEAIKQVKPWGVDVSSGVEIKKGIKDIAKIKSFIINARLAFKESRNNDNI
jgi:phosphoribosylanthranilate isomerase